MSRRLKQILIILSFFLLFLSLVFLSYRILNKPNCYDGKKNGTEEDIDCGGSCVAKCQKNPDLKELKFSQISIVEDHKKSDIAVKVINDNLKFGLKDVQYNIKLFREDIEVGRTQGKFFILPNESFYLVAIGVETSQKPDRGELEIVNKKWEELQEREKPKLEILNKNFKYPGTIGEFFEVNFQIVNRSHYNFSLVDLVCIIEDNNGKIIAINKGNINHIKVGEVRDFRFFWPREFVGEVGKIQIEARGDLFNLSNIY